MPRKDKPKTRTQSYMVDKLSVMSQRTVSLHSKAHASEEAGSLSAPRTAPSELTHVALRARTRSNSSRQLFVKNSYG
jgi:hypothetical protein